MPALVVFGRRSRVVGSDDLYFPALVLLLFQLPLVLLCALYVSLWRRCSTLTFDETGLPFWYMLGAIPVVVFMACVDLMVMHVSAKGTMVDHERRMVMPRVLHVHALWSALSMAYGLAGVSLWYCREMCYPDSNFVLAVGGCLVAEVSFTFTLGFCLLSDQQFKNDRPAGTSSVDPYGNALECERQSLLDEENDREVPNSDVYVPHTQSLWTERCNRCCTCVQCFTCNLFGGAGTRHDSMSVVARVFSRLFYGSPDLVLSDIVAGFILLAAVQAHEDLADDDSEVDADTADAMVEEKTLAELRGQVLSSSSTVTMPASNTSNRSSADGDGSHIEYSAISIPPSSSGMQYHDHHDFGDDRELGTCIEELAHFSQFAVGIYGWMLYVWSHPWSGTLRLAFSCMKRNLPHIHGDNWFHLGQTALQLETKVLADDIVYASFANTVYRPAFCVILDHKRQEIVIAIRGTLSLEDCLTDAIAYGISMNGVAERWGCDGAGEFAHQGFLHCAEAIYLELNRLGILEMLLDPRSTASIATDSVNRCKRGTYKDYGIVVTGHSLGAGTAVLLSVMLRPKYPNLRCFAFSPPGCTMSPGIARRCAEFTVSVVVGDDIIARSSLSAAEALRDQVLDLIRRSKVGKASILRQVIAWKRPDELLNDENACEDTEFSMHLANYRTMLQRIQATEPISPLTIPGRLVHLRRSKRAARPVSGCWVCCRPGADGVCCTSRTNYQFAWSSPNKFSSIRIARSMLDDHFPDKVHYVLQDCVKRARRVSEEDERAKAKATTAGEQSSCLG